MVFALNQADWAAATVAQPDYATDWHAHDCAMLLLPRQGLMVFEMEGRPSPSQIRPGEALLVAPGVGHRTRAADAAHRHIVLYAPGTRLGRWLPAGRGWHLGLLPPTMLPLLSYRDALPEGSERAELAERLLLAEATEAGPEPAPAQHGAAVVQAIAEHLRARLQGPHALDDLATRFGLSRRQMTRLFRRHTGTSIASYLGGLRVREAAQRIGAGQGVLAAAHAVGLASPSHLARLFRQHTSGPPSASRSGEE
ncbi:helix-turn-helix domain-containing protein [Muricoccus vinaceus]|uniref:Helix-turn-helix domain-containing protein n=1 Tax=Muricoccus vinaceus TaxID=424704 RepID=A0ABV6J0S1_9PROT